MHIPDQESRGHIVPRKNYILTGIALLVLTVITVAVSYVDWGVVIGGGFVTNVVIAMIIATIKASLVILVFMHMRYETTLVKGYGLLFPIILFVILVSFSVIDIFGRNIPDEPDVLREQREAQALNAPAAE